MAELTGEKAFLDAIIEIGTPREKTLAKAILRLNETEKPVFLFHEREKQERVELHGWILEEFRNAIKRDTVTTEFGLKACENILDAFGIPHKETKRVELGKSTIGLLRQIATYGNSVSCNAVDFSRAEARAILDACDIPHKEPKPEPEKMEPFESNCASGLRESGRGVDATCGNNEIFYKQENIPGMIKWLQEKHAKNEGMKGGAES